MNTAEWNKTDVEKYYKKNQHSAGFAFLKRFVT